MEDADVRVRHETIPMADGTLLAARVHEPARERPLPALVEYSPYRSDDLALAWFGRFWDALAAAGFAVVRIDVRGTGSSTGIVQDEYTQTETQDGVAAIEWIARQPWCSGQVGMFGISYSGFTALQVAAERPAGLEAIVAVSATDDRYTDDVHYGGGALRLQENAIWYGPWMVALNALPPDSSLGNWESIWQERLERMEPWLFNWLQHPRDGAYWRVGSIRGLEDRITCPTYLVSGWQDGYRNAALRLYERLTVPKRCLIGPWAHYWPDEAVPGPAIDFTADVARWFHDWLGEHPPSHRDELTVFVQDRLQDGEDTRGNWYCCDRLVASEERFTASDATLLRNGRDTEHPDVLRLTPGAGVLGIPWGGMPWIRWPDDLPLWPSTGVSYTTPALDDSFVVLGRPRVETQIGDLPGPTNLTARLTDISPDGQAQLITTGVIALDEQNSPGPVTLELDATAWRLRPQHRLRLTLDGCDWPNVWPAPSLGTFSLQSATLVLPAATLEDWTLTQLAPPATLPLPRCDIAASPYTWHVSRDAVARSWNVSTDFTMDVDLPDGRFGWSVAAVCMLEDRRPDLASVRSTNRLLYERGGLAVKTEARLNLAATSTQLTADLALEVERDGRIHLNRQWTRSFPRDAS